MGQVKYVFNSADGLSFRLKVKLATDFGKLRDVCVVDNTELSERMQLFNAAKDSILLKQKD